MKVLISEKLSEHKYKTPEGYLICTDAILARTGKQSYTKDELFCDGDNTEVNVDRPYDEVMNAKTIASFENKPITFDHPDEDVNVGNYKDYAIGYVRDVHQGKTDKGEDVILGNLVITDQDAINAIEQGDHTDLSCGYDCDIRDDGSGNYSQTNIRGNHLALCEQGRAGIAHIVDSKMNDKLSYEAASSDDNYLDEVEKMIYKFANVRVDAMLVGDKLKISPKTSRGFNSKQLNDIASVLMKNVAVSNITISNPDKFDSNVTAKIVDSKARDSKIEKVPPELLLNLNDWFSDKLYIERKYHVKIYNIISNEGLTVTGSRQDLEKLYKDYHLENGYHLKIVDSKVEDDNLLGKKVRIRKRYSNLDGTIGTIYSYEGTNYDDKVEVKRNGHIYEVDYEDIEFLDSKVEDVNYSEKEIKEAAMKLLKQKPFLTYEEALQKVKENIRNGNYLLDSKVEDAEYTYKLTKKKNDYDEYVIQAYKNGKKNEDATYYTDDWDDAINTLKSIAKQEKLTFRQQGSVFIADNKARDTDLVIGKTYTTKSGHKLTVNKVYAGYSDVTGKPWVKIEYSFVLTNGYKGKSECYAEDFHKMMKDSLKDSKIEDSKIDMQKQDFEQLDVDACLRELKRSGIHDSKEMTMSDAIKMLNIVDIYKKVKDASKNEWVIKNTGLAYEIWNQGKMVKKFPTKKLAIEWIHSRFPTDEITEDSTKDDKLWQTLTRKAKY